MMYDGKRFQRCRAKTWLACLEFEEPNRNTCVIGRVIPQGQPLPKNAVATGSTWKKWQWIEASQKEGWVSTGEPVYAVPIPIIAGGTNLVHAPDGKSYLVIDGRVYSRPGRLPEAWKDRKPYQLKQPK